MAWARLTADIDRRIAHISTHVNMGADKVVVVSEQCQALLTSCSMLRGVELDPISNVSSQLVAQDMSFRSQLLAFSANLRGVAAATPLDKPTSRPMQSNKAIEHCLLTSGWGRLEELGKQSQQGRDQLEDIVAIKMHRLGIVCPDADT